MRNTSWLSDMNIVLVFKPHRRYKTPKGTSLPRTLNTRGIVRFSTDIAIYLENGTKLAYGITDH